MAAKASLDDDLAMLGNDQGFQLFELFGLLEHAIESDSGFSGALQAYDEQERHAECVAIPVGCLCVGAGGERSHLGMTRESSRRAGLRGGLLVRPLRARRAAGPAYGY